MSEAECQEDSLSYPRKVAIRLSRERLAALADTTPDRIQELTQLGLLRPRGRSYAAGDLHRVRLIDAFGAAGVPADVLAQASEQGAISLTYYDQLHQDAGLPAAHTYRELLSELGGRAPDLRRLFGAFGVAEPDADNHLSRDDERLLMKALETLEVNRDPDLALRALRVFGDHARRGSEAAMSVYSEAVERAGSEVVGVPALELYERFIQPWARFARLVPDLTAWLSSRHLSAAIDAWSVAETEQLLGETGFVARREAEPPAVAFIDLTAFTSLTQERGDRIAAEISAAFANLAGEIVERHGGRLVKQLGDGVLLRFAELRSGVEATLEVLDRLQDANLPLGHAGIDAGPIVVREGDVFGSTVNRASRIADHAQPGQLLAAAELVPGLPADVQHAPAGVVSLRGISEPVALARIWREELSESQA